MSDGYHARDVAELLGWPVSRVYGYVHSELVHPQRDRRGYVFVFQDLVVLRAARELIDAHVSPRRVKYALVQLRERIADGRPLSALHLAAAGDRIVVRDGNVLWEPESGQAQLDWGAPRPTSQPEPLQLATYGAASDEAYNRGVELEDSDAGAAITAYRKAIELDNRHADAHINLGRLLQQQGDISVARNHYEQALDRDPAHVIARFNLATALEDQGDIEAALIQYLAVAPQLTDAHINLARIYEAKGDRASAIRHLRALRLLR